MEIKREFRKVTRTEAGGQLIRIPKAFGRGLGIDGDVLKMFCADGRLVIEKVQECVEIYGMDHQNHLVCRSKSNLNPWESMNV